MPQKNRSDGPRGDQNLVDRNVRLLYDGLIEEGLPDRFQELIDVIRAEDREQDLKKNDDA